MILRTSRFPDLSLTRLTAARLSDCVLGRSNSTHNRRKADPRLCARVRHLRGGIMTNCLKLLDSNGLLKRSLLILSQAQGHCASQGRRKLAELQIPERAMRV